jgi:hypothetical protein
VAKGYYGYFEVLLFWVYLKLTSFAAQMKFLGPQISTAMVKDSQQIITKKELSSYCTPGLFYEQKMRLTSFLTH